MKSFLPANVSIMSVISDAEGEVMSEASSHCSTKESVCCQQDKTKIDMDPVIVILIM